MEEAVERGIIVSASIAVDRIHGRAGDLVGRRQLRVCPENGVVDAVEAAVESKLDPHLEEPLRREGAAVGHAPLFL